MLTEHNFSCLIAIAETFFDIWWFKKIRGGKARGANQVNFFIFSVMPEGSPRCWLWTTHHHHHHLVIWWWWWWWCDVDFHLSFVYFSLQLAFWWLSMLKNIFDHFRVCAFVRRVCRDLQSANIAASILFDSPIAMSKFEPWSWKRRKLRFPFLRRCIHSRCLYSSERWWICSPC